MKNQILISTSKKFLLFLGIILASLFTGCSDDPESTNEEEVITTVIVELVPVIGAETPDNAEVVTLSWDDINLDATVDPTEVIASGPLLPGETYNATIQILNRSGSSEVDITTEVKEEAEEHIFCFTITGAGISISNLDKDKNGLPLGITSTWTTSTASTGTVNIALRHQPGVKTGDCPGFGDTDAEITFDVSVSFE